ncbi:uncharacterized protein LOC114536534 [Dendronephthya gigantea]|uniref:uncharacterized protein LOC114536534 n=1 Tax=Dendronephthya gigantea TaxID=151771 RepID=UPI00106CA95D|nr:uncharacterized protein LOC114536534 [Dendronephthya gigantea]
MIMMLAEASVEEISTSVEMGDPEDIEADYEKLCGLLKKLDLSIDKAKDEMVEKEETLSKILEWSNEEKTKMKKFRDLKSKLKESLAKIQMDRDKQSLRKEIEKQRAINEENERARRREKEEMEELEVRRIQREEEWLLRKLEIEKEAKKQLQENTSQATATQSVKLQKYTITPFTGDFKDWTRFWNQFSVEVDGSSISEISKFNYLLELTKGKPREDILGLPHTSDGYSEAKRILLETYGKDIKVHKAIIQDIESLQQITDIHKTTSIHEFYNKLSRAVRTLTTMKKLDSAQSTVYTVMDKLGPVREILAMADDNWEEWKLEELTENLRKYVERNPLQTEKEEKPKKRDQNKKRVFHEQNRKVNTRRVYCGNEKHKSSNCLKVLTVTSRREILKKNRLCYNCTGKGHTALTCRSRNCVKCGQKHHTSLCDSEESSMEKEKSKLGTENTVKQSIEKNMSFSSNSTTLHPTVKAKVNDRVVRVMIDTGASTSYICSEVITKLSLKPVRRERKCIEQLYGTVTKNVDIYRIHIQSIVVDDFELDIDCINAGKEVLTYLPNPKVKDLKMSSKPFQKLQLFDEETTDRQIPVHIILGAADYQRIKSAEQLILGENPDTDPGAEFTKLGWALCGKIVSMESAEKEFFLNSQSEFEKLCSVDVLGLAEKLETETEFHENFIKHLHQTDKGFYETDLPWRPDHPMLPANRALTVARLRSTTRRLEKLGKLDEYHSVMEGQLREGILEPVPPKPTGEVVHYIPHQPVIREDAESTKLRIVYDCSAKADPQIPSLNDCLEKGPSLQPLLFDILLRNRLRSKCITGDLKKAFLQVRINKQHCDAQRMLWYNKEIVEYRFTRVIFGAAPSPYILGATLQQHVKQFQDEYPEATKALLEDTYVDDVQSGGDLVSELETFKKQSTIIMEKGKVLAAINGVYDLLGWASPVMITGKILFSELCLRKVSWDEQVPDDIGRRWNKWAKTLRECTEITVPQSVVKPMSQQISIHGFADASQDVVTTFQHEEFKQQLQQNYDGFYETGLPWKSDCMPLPENKNQTIARLHNITRKLERMGKLEEL